MKKLTEDQRHLIASLAADEVHKSLMEAASQRYWAEMNSCDSVRQGLEKAFQKIMRNVYAKD